MMLQRDSKVIGFFAYRSPAEVGAEVNACVIAGSEEAMREYIHEVDARNAGRTTIKKTRFGEIVRGLQAGGAYAFDEESYSRFFPLAREAGIPVSQADFENEQREGRRFFTVQIVPG